MPYTPVSVLPLREQRAELPSPGLSAEAAAEQIEKTAERNIAEVHQREARELSRLDKLIAAARELAVEVKERATEMARHVAERVEPFLERQGAGTSPPAASREPAHAAFTLIHPSDKLQVVKIKGEPVAWVRPVDG